MRYFVKRKTITELSPEETEPSRISRVWWREKVRTERRYSGAAGHLTN